MFCLRDAENFVDIILMIVTWICPVLYSWHNVYDVFGGTIYWKLYQLNPLAPAVELFHDAFGLLHYHQEYQIARHICGSGQLSLKIQHQ